MVLWSQSGSVKNRAISHVWTSLPGVAEMEDHGLPEGLLQAGQSESQFVDAATAEFNPCAANVADLGSCLSARTGCRWASVPAAGPGC